MYKRKGCDIWIIEEKDFESGLDWSELETLGDKRVSLKNLSFPMDIDLINMTDVGLEINNRRYLGYLDNFRDIITEDKKKTVREIEFYICIENYLDGVEVIRDIEVYG